MGVATATWRHSSAAILRRIGLTSLSVDGEALPPYHDPQYDCSMEVLRFDSRLPNPRYRQPGGAIWGELESAPTICTENMRAHFCKIPRCGISICRQPNLRSAAWFRWIRNGRISAGCRAAAMGGGGGGGERDHRLPHRCARPRPERLKRGTRCRPSCGPVIARRCRLVFESRTGSGTPVYPISSGKNWGYGSRARCATRVLLDLGRMNRILDFNEELAYVTIEPGVTQRQLYDFLSARSRLWMDSHRSEPRLQHDREYDGARLRPYAVRRPLRERLWAGSGTSRPAMLSTPASDASPRRKRRRLTMGRGTVARRAVLAIELRDRDADDASG